MCSQTMLALVTRPGSGCLEEPVFVTLFFVPRQVLFTKGRRRIRFSLNLNYELGVGLFLHPEDMFEIHFRHQDMIYTCNVWS